MVSLPDCSQRRQMLFSAAFAASLLAGGLQRLEEGIELLGPGLCRRLVGADARRRLLRDSERGRNR